MTQLSEEEFRHYKNQIKLSVMDHLERLAVSSTKGLRGKLLHMQDMDAPTDDVDVLKTRPTAELTSLVEVVADRKQASRPLVRIVIQQLQDEGRVAVTFGGKISKP